jgi:hypothetical protein
MRIAAAAWTAAAVVMADTLFPVLPKTPFAVRFQLVT